MIQYCKHTLTINCKCYQGDCQAKQTKHLSLAKHKLANIVQDHALLKLSITTQTTSLQVYCNHAATTVYIVLLLNT